MGCCRPDRRGVMTGARACRQWFAAAGIVVCAGGMAASADPGQKAPEIQRGSHVEAEVAHDTSPPLWLIPPAPRREGQRVHRVLPLPRPHPGSPTPAPPFLPGRDRKSTRLNSSHGYISYAVFCLKKKKKEHSQIAHEKKSNICYYGDIYTYVEYKTSISQYTTAWCHVTL